MALRILYCLFLHEFSIVSGASFARQVL
jgi:hypothetical protein